MLYFMQLIVLCYLTLCWIWKKKKKKNEKEKPQKETLAKLPKHEQNGLWITGREIKHTW